MNEEMPRFIDGQLDLTHRIEVEAIIGKGVKLVVSSKERPDQSYKVVVFIGPKEARELGDSIFRAAQVAEQ